jgi:hypothetical protein
MKVNAIVFPVVVLVFAAIVFPAIAQDVRLAILEEPFPVHLSQGLVEVMGPHGLITNVECKLQVTLPANFPMFTASSVEIETNMSLWKAGEILTGFRKLNLSVVLPAGVREATVRVNGKRYGSFIYEITSKILAESEVPLIQADLS